ncbi:MAG: hypothetical protein NT160_06770 [Actinobacteria bacterium]|nr:hypothetical protein [Actinomycetota bacterium]
MDYFDEEDANFVQPRKLRPLGEIYADLDALVLAISSSAVGSYGQEWIGADVAFVDHEEERFELHGWSPCLQVPSPHFLVLGWLMSQLKEIMGEWVDAGNKYECYGRLGRSVNAFSELYGRDIPQEAVLLACAHEAYALTEQFGVDGDLPSLAVSFNGEIADDFEGLAGQLMPLRAKGVRERLEALGFAL